MNKISLTLFILTFLLLGCKKFDEKTQFEMDYNQTVVVPSSTLIDLGINLFTPETETNSESTFAINDTRKDKIEEIKLKEMTLNLTSPSGADFSFLESIRIYINAEGLGEKEVAWKSPVPETTAGTLTMDVSDSDFKEYIKKDEFSLRVNTVTDETLGSDHEIEVASVFFVDALVLGQ